MKELSSDGGEILNRTMLSDLYDNLTVCLDATVPPIEEVTDPSALFEQTTDGALVFYAYNSPVQTWHGLYEPTGKGITTSPYAHVIAPGRLSTEDGSLPSEVLLVAATQLYACGGEAERDLAIELLGGLVDKAEKQASAEVAFV